MLVEITERAMAHVGGGKGVGGEVLIVGGVGCEFGSLLSLFSFVASFQKRLGFLGCGRRRDDGSSRRSGGRRGEQMNELTRLGFGSAFELDRQPPSPGDDEDHG